MIFDESQLKVGGRPLLFKVGHLLTSLGAKMMSKHRHKTVTNPTSKLANPFTLIVSFTVDNNDKYQIVIQGDYKKIYKETEDNTPDISQKELFIIIGENQNLWYKKE